MASIHEREADEQAADPIDFRNLLLGAWPDGGEDEPEPASEAAGRRRRRRSAVDHLVGRERRDRVGGDRGCADPGRHRPATGALISDPR